jgi:hypothetical protein
MDSLALQARPDIGAAATWQARFWLFLSLVIFDDVGVNLGGFDAAVAEHFLDVTATGNAAEGIPRGNIRGGRDLLAGGTWTGMQHYNAHVTWPRRRAAHVISRQRDAWRCGATIFGELLEWENGRLC